ncbi:MAG: methyltransferase domain-containing protein [Rhizobiaceae bacterium]|nr:methyltransferase domain-containing protein [Rhizobiaceae bacterium]MCV0407264.1 methyltransferase domain-containing protein [Rhizobiaceae bacterium]
MVLSRAPRPQARERQSNAPDRPGLAARRTAARLLAAIVDSKVSLDGLTDPEHGHGEFLRLEVRDRALVRAILVTALRRRRTIERAIAARLDRPLPANATTLSHLLHVAAAQILFLDVPDSAAVDLAVEQARADPRTRRFASLVNAVLRGVSRHADQARADPGGDAPDWFVSRLKAAYGDERARRILDLHRVEAPVDFTVKDDAEGWAARLDGIVLPTGSVRVGKLPARVPDLPGYVEGHWWVQDAAAALPARLLGEVRGLRVADLCAAPGGKTAQLAAAGAQVTAIDVSASRLKRLRTNLLRLAVEADVVEADLFAYRPTEAFDAVLLDAPCSSTGTVRRHPDVPWTKGLDDIETLAALQERMLRRAVELVKPGGRIVFSNCSLDPREGEALVERVLATDSRFARDSVRAGEFAGIDPFILADGTLRTTPADLDMGRSEISGLDGFFAARLRWAG